MTARSLRCLALGLWLCACVGEIPEPMGPRGPDARNAATGGDDGPEGSGPGTAEGAVSSANVRLRRLTVHQYQNSVRDLMGNVRDVSQLTAIAPLHGLAAIGASSLSIPERDIEAFAALAEQSAAELFEDGDARMGLVGCDASDAACARGFVPRFARRVFRRPLSADEEARYLTLLATASTETGDGWLALRVVVSALLQSPHFLYRVELGEVDPSDGARRRLSAFELASRLSFFLWNTTPDEQLLDAAAGGLLDTDEGLAQQADRLLGSTRAAEAAEALFTDYLRLDALDRLQKLPELFPQASESLAGAMKAETLLTLRTLAFERAVDFRELLTTRTSFVNAELAALYGVELPAGAGELREVTLPEDGQRAGLLMQASFLASHAHPGRSSPTLRGKFIRESLLCQGIPPPPDNVDTTLDMSDTGPRTARQKLTAHRENPACSGCHALMDPIGLALENFDGIGAYRTTEQGLAIDPSGELDGAPFADALGLSAALAEHPDTARCFVRTLLRYARGALETASERALIGELEAAFAQGGYRMPALMKSIVTDPAFRYVGAL